MSLEINRVGGLLQICDLSKNWPSLRSIHDVAMSQLEQISTDLQKELAEHKAAVEKAAADKAAAQTEIDRANAEAEAPTDDTATAPSSVDETHADLTRRI